MKQLIQNYKSGELYVEELPIPSIMNGYVLIANQYSLISAGTEKSTVSTAQASLIGKAKKRPDLVKQVIQNYKKEGLRATIEKVKTKLDTLSPLGYSSAGVVIASLDSESKYQPGDWVACAGYGFASHAEVICVPENLIAKVPDKVDMREAAFTTLGAIALQGVRQADPKLGENICVIGLGLLGQITCQLLKANGCNVFGIDVSPNMVALTNQTGSAVAYERNDSNLIPAIYGFTNGYSFDKVIITAAGHTNDPIELSGQILRRKGVVVVVGAVNMNVPRDPDYYKKELEVKLSCSYGPGRYDPRYEEEGIDYPYEYVRFTEQRNMETFLKLLANKTISIDKLISHEFIIDDAIQAYDIILGKRKEPYVGILLKYDVNNIQKINSVEITRIHEKINDLNIAFIGAGSFAQSYLIPYSKSLGSLNSVVTRNGLHSKNVAEKFGFINASTESDSIYLNKDINVVFIATHHNTHASYVAECLKHGKNVFVEKPLALNDSELSDVINIHSSSSSSYLMVGFNRRFAPLSVKAKSIFQNIGEPLIMNFRINAGFIPKDHWIQTEAGGGRIIGEMCHFIDLMQYLSDSEPSKVFAECINTNNDRIKNDDNISITVKFTNGSVGNLVYTANGDKALSKERIEVFGGNKVYIIDDFAKGYFFENNKEKVIKSPGKGHKEEIEAFFENLTKGKGSPITFRSICLTTLTTFKVIESLNTGLPQEINL